MILCRGICLHALKAVKWKYGEGKGLLNSKGVGLKERGSEACSEHFHSGPLPAHRHTSLAHLYPKSLFTSLKYLLV